MLDSIFANQESFKTMVKLGKAPSPVEKLNWPKMKLMAVVLRPFADDARMFESEKYPADGLVVGTICYLRKTLVTMQEHEDGSIQGASGAALADVDQRRRLEPNANTSGKAGLTDVHLICACTNPRAKALKHLPGILNKYSWEALETVLLSDAASKVESKRQDDIDAGLMPDDATNADGGSKNGGEAKDEGAGDKPKSLARMVLEGNESDDEEDSQSNDGDWGNYSTAPEKADEYSHMQRQYEAQVKKELIQYRGLDPPAPDEDPLQWWATRERDFPMISDVAARYLRSSALSASSERLYLPSKKSMRLTGDSIARILSVRGAIVWGVLDSYYEQT